jgi:hypothetical protein
MSLSSTAESSPRLLSLHNNPNQRRLPRLPLENVGIGYSEHEFASSMTDDSSLPSPGGTAYRWGILELLN